ncbi:ubiquitin-conjugating enzyme E2 Z-like [Dermacentor silvarum]|uniref:ubiquitin-conjugating enzyme E2 Z-like n=1 Tax=Dermacentor silvarum TaxID=543639 RepID=UPI0021007205|nr:ubiquitin-conjugating enzyme E2 Z-like [Dermacentor silvarum]
MLTTNWDPKTIENQGPSASCLLRVKQDIAEIKADPLPGIYVSPEKNDLTKFHAIVVGPSGTPYEGGFFQFFMKCSRQLPDAATPHTTLDVSAPSSSSPFLDNCPEQWNDKTPRLEVICLI